MKICGIYQIRNIIDNKRYIGQSVDIKSRWAHHKYSLNKGNHYNKYLQKAWNKYNKCNFIFEILQECNKECLNELEEQYAESFCDKLYNLSKDFTSREGIKNPFYGKTHLKESKIKMSNWKKNNYLGENNPNYGIKHPKEIGLKMTLNNSKTKLNVSKVKQIVELLKECKSHDSIAKQFDVSRTVITRISNGTRWTNVTGGPVIPVEYKNGKRVFSEIHRKRLGESRKHSSKLKFFY